MTAAIAYPALAQAVARLHGAGGGAVPGHAYFGALFLFIGALLAVEILAGPIWQRNRLRTMLWPAALFASGLGMLVVSYFQSSEKALHLTLDELPAGAHHLPQGGVVRIMELEEQGYVYLRP